MRVVTVTKMMMVMMTTTILEDKRSLGTKRHQTTHLERTLLRYLGFAVHWALRTSPCGTKRFGKAGPNTSPKMVTQISTHFERHKNVTERLVTRGCLSERGIKNVTAFGNQHWEKRKETTLADGLEGTGAGDDVDDADADDDDREDNPTLPQAISSHLPPSKPSTPKNPPGAASFPVLSTCYLL